MCLDPMPSYSATLPCPSSPAKWRRGLTRISIAKPRLSPIWPSPGDYHRCMMRIALLVTVLMAIGTQAQTAKVDGWRKLSIPEGLGGKCCDLQSAYAANDGYIYISGDAGTFRARVETPEQWTNISDGLHKYERGIKPALVFGETPRGEILAGVGHGRPCSSCEIVKWDPTDTKWYSMKADFKPGTVRWSGFAYDSKGNIWASSYMGGSIYRSKNDGKNFEEVIPGGYRIVGQPGGAISAFIIINDELYWGGEGGLMR